MSATATVSPVLQPVTKMLPLLLGALILLSGCGADGSDDDQGGVTGGEPRVADARFEGDFEIADISRDGQQVALSTAATLNFETVFGGLTVAPGCNTYFGSFTLAEDGTASITVAGGSKEDCGARDAQELVVLDALAAVTAWVETDTGFRFTGQDQSFELVR